MYMGYLCPFSDRCNLGVIWCSRLKMSCTGNSKTASRRAKKSEIWEIIQHIWGTLDLLVLKVILGSFSALVSKRPVSRKRLAVEQN